LGAPRCSPLRSVSPSGAPLQKSPSYRGEGTAEHRSVSPMLKGISRAMVANFGIDTADLRVDRSVLLGTGGFGKVYLGDYQATEVAVKVASADREWTEEEKSEWKTEVQIMTRLRHPNILMLLGAVFEADSLAIVTELCERGTLLQVLMEAREKGDDRESNTWQARVDRLGQIAKGMAFLHHKRIFHRDLKPSNVFVAQGGIMKIADFGLSRIRRDLRKGLRAAQPDAERGGQEKGRGQAGKSGGGMAKENSRIQGTFAFIAPEVWAEHPYTEKGDVYSFGVTVLQVLMLDVPFEHDHRRELSWRIMKGKTRPCVPLMLGGAPLPRGLRSLITTCIDYSPANRPFFTDIVTLLKDELRESYCVDRIPCPWPQKGEIRGSPTDRDPLAEDVEEMEETAANRSGSRRDRTEWRPQDQKQFASLPTQQQLLMKKLAAVLVRRGEGEEQAILEDGLMHELETAGGTWNDGGRIEQLLLRDAPRGRA